MSTEHVPKTLPVGHTCRYYPRGDTSREPVAAVVTATSRSGQLNLTLLAMNAHNVQPISGVRHRDDPYHDDHPDHARENGVWDYLEAVCDCCDVKPHNVTIEALEATASPDELLAAFYAEHGDGASKTIAENMTAVTGEPWNHQKVNMRLRLMKKQGKLTEHRAEVTSGTA
jgi:hypothetical protein